MYSSKKKCYFARNKFIKLIFINNETQLHFYSDTESCFVYRM